MKTSGGRPRVLRKKRKLSRADIDTRMLRQFERLVGRLNKKERDLLLGLADKMAARRRI